jgi:hypothetical protein
VSPPFSSGVFIGATLDVGTLPAASPGVDVGAGLRVRRMDLSVAFRWLSKRSQSIDSPADAGGEFTLYTSQLRGCFAAPLGRRFELGPCGLGELGALRGTGFGVVAPRSTTAAWSTLGAGAFARWTSRYLSLDLRLDVVAPLTRIRYVLDGIGTVYRASPVALRCALLVTTFFP